MTTPIIHFHFIPVVLAHARERGIDTADLHVAHSLEPDAADRHFYSMTVESQVQIAEAVATRCEDPFLGLRLAESTLTTLGLIDMMAASCPTVGDGFDCLLRYQSRLNLAFRGNGRREDGRFILEQSVFGGPRDQFGRHANEYIVARLVRAVREISGRRAKPLAVRFSHERTGDLQPLVEYFGTADLTFGCESNGMDFAEDLLALKVATADPDLLALLVQHATTLPLTEQERIDFRVRVREQIRTELAAHGATSETVARALKMSPRTLQRRLEAEGTSFTALLDDERRSLAVGQLDRGTIRLQELAENLGYADPRVFHRAFKRWTGMSPSEWRARPTKTP